MKDIRQINSLKEKYPEKDYILEHSLYAYLPGNENFTEMMRDNTIGELYRMAGGALIEKHVDLGKPIIVESMAIDEVNGDDMALTKLIYIAVKWKVMEEEG